MTRLFATVLLAALAVGCEGNSPMSPSVPSGAGSQTSATGTWTGTASDSSSAAAAGGMMGQTGMGSMTWQLTHTGSNVTGTMTFSGMPGHMPGTLSGTITGDEMTFRMDMPVRSMMMSGCSADATGTARMNWTTMTMTGTYHGTHSCSGPFVNGQVTMTRR